MSCTKSSIPGGQRWEGRAGRAGCFHPELLDLIHPFHDQLQKWGSPLVCPLPVITHLASIKAALSHFFPTKSQGVILSLALQLKQDEAPSHAFHSELLEYVNRQERICQTKG